MAYEYAGKGVIVTGASSGIGRQAALDFARRGARLVISARRAERLEDTARECRTLGAEVEVMVGDLGERAFAESMVERSIARFGRVDVLVNNAGIPKHKEIYDVTAEDVETTLRINFLAPAYLILAAIPPMLRQGEGYIINVSSGAGRLPSPREAVYTASKFALTGFSEGLILDLAGSGIHVAVLHVGPIETEIWDKAESPHVQQFRKHPPSLISDAIFTCIEKKRHEVTAPRWLSPLFGFKALLPGLFRWGAQRAAPVPAEVVDGARERARRQGA